MKSDSDTLKHARRSSSLRILLLLIGMFLILIVNREFGVADNGDFARYIRPIATKPAGFDVNSPEAQTKAWHARFFNEPLNHWVRNEDPGAAPAWFTSAALFWYPGKALGTLLYSGTVVNVRYVGLFFFLLQAAVLAASLLSIKMDRPLGALAGLATVALLTDARVSAFYNSFYSESVPILAVLVTFCFFTARMYMDQDSALARRLVRGLGVAALALLCLAIFAKRQYLYFLVPTILAGGYLVFSAPRDRKAARVAWYAAGVLALVGATISLTYLYRVNNLSGRTFDAVSQEADGTRITSYHALYFGLLPHAKDPPKLIERLGLPPESAALVGSSVWRDDATALVVNTPAINPRTFFKAIALEPLAFAKSIMTNAKEIGNFQVDLGMVQGAQRQHPPTLIRLPTTAATALSGRQLCIVALLLGSAMVIFGFGLPFASSMPNRVLALVLLAILSADPLISTFDGQQEARKHVLVGSLASVLILAQATLTAACWLAAKAKREHLRARPLDANVSGK